MNRNHILIFSLLVLITALSIFIVEHKAQARTEQIVDTSNNNLRLSMEAPNDWNSGTISQTINKLDWRLNALTANNDNFSAFFAVSNLPSLASFALPLGEKTGILSLILGQYVTINGESDITLSDGSKAHRYSITATPEQLHALNVPIDKGIDAVLITTNQQGGSYIVLYAAPLGRMGEFENLFQNMLQSVKFG